MKTKISIFITAAIFLLLGATSVIAQNINFKKNGATVFQRAISGIDSIVFKQEFDDSDNGVVINGVRWATRNVDAPGTFAIKPEDGGMLYQWNRIVGWSATDPMINTNGGTSWDNSFPDGGSWETANDPSPEGWRLPTFDEIQKLLDENNVNNEWITINGVSGRKFTDIATGNSIFLPAAGTRSFDDGMLMDGNQSGFYWSSSQYNTSYAYILRFAGGWIDYNTYPTSFGFCVRSVADTAETEYKYIDIDWNTNIITDYNKDTGEINIQFQGTVPSLKENNVIILPVEYKHEIRVINTSTRSGNNVTLQTTHGNICNLFMDTSFTLSTDPSLSSFRNTGSNIITPSEIGIMTDKGYKIIYNRENAMLKSATDYEYGGEYDIFSFNKDYSGEDLYNKNGHRLFWDKCVFDIGLKGVFTFDFGKIVEGGKLPIGSLKTFDFYLDGHLNIDLLLEYIFSAAVKESKENPIKNNIYSIDFCFVVGGVPVYILVNADLYDRYELDAETEVSMSMGCNLQANAKVGLNYTKGAGVSPITDFNSSFTLHEPTFTAKGSLSAKGSIYPRIELGIYDCISPWVEPMPYLKEDLGAGMRISTDGNNYLGWTSKSYTGLDCRMGLDMDVAMWDMNVWKSDIFNIKDYLLFDAPNKIDLVSPENGKELTAGEPIDVTFCVSSLNNLLGNYSPCPAATVNFNASGSLDKTVAVSADNGLVSVQWTPNNNIDYLTAKIVDKDGQTISEATFSPAYLPDSLPNIIPLEYIETLKELGIKIYGGIDPPFIEGTYLLSPMKKVNANFFEWGSATYDEELTFYNQDTINLKLQMNSHTFNNSGFVDNSESTAEGIGGFISGHDSAFSIFMKVVTLNVYGDTIEGASVISGEWTAGGIRNYQEALIMVNDHGDSRNIYIENGQARLWIDGDGFSEKINSELRSSRLPKEAKAPIKLGRGLKTIQ